MTAAFCNSSSFLNVGIISPQRFLSAFATLSASASKNCIFSAVFMSIRAMSLCCMAGANRISAKNVCSRSYGFKMLGIYAKRVSAEVINLKPFGNRSNVKLVRKSMGVKSELSRLSRVVNAVKNGSELSVANAFRPNPIPTLLSFFHMAHEQRPVVLKQGIFHV
jgi:hypothetical protein